MKTLINIIVVFMFTQTFAQTISTPQYIGSIDMMNYVSLNKSEIDVLQEVLLIDKDINRAQEELLYTDKRINDLDRITTLSSEFKDIQTKAKKKQNRFLDNRIFLLGDIEELIVINQQLIYHIYENKLEDKNLIQGSNNVREVRRYIEKASMQYAIAESYIKKVDNAVDDEEFIRTLKEANKAYISSVENQRFALGLCYSVDLAIIEANTEYYSTNNLNKLMLASVTETGISDSILKIEEPVLIAEQGTKLPSELENDSVIINKSESNIASDNKLEVASVSKKPMTINKDLTFRIQIGAFTKEVYKEELNGLSPLFIDKSDSTFDKVLVGEHHSYRSAIAALRVIRQTTKYTDAFVVMYCRGEREPIKNMLEQDNIDSTEKNAYISYKNTQK